MADDTGKTVFVTVGTTSFDGLIKRVMTIDVIEVRNVIFYYIMAIFLPGIVYNT